MTEKIVNGDYVYENDGFLQTDGIEELLQNAEAVLRCRREKFYPDKNFGSRLSGISCAPVRYYAVCFARQAAEGLDGLFIADACEEDGAIVFDVLVNGERRKVKYTRESDL